MTDPTREAVEAGGRQLTIELTRQGNYAMWCITYPSGARRYRRSAIPLGEIVTEFLTKDGDEMVVLPAGFSYTYNSRSALDAGKE